MLSDGHVPKKLYSLHAQDPETRQRESTTAQRYAACTLPTCNVYKHTVDEGKGTISSTWISEQPVRTMKSLSAAQ